MAQWEPTSEYLPQYKERPMSSEKWRATIFEIYSYLNRMKSHTTEAEEEPEHPVKGSVWFDTTDPANPRLKVFDGTSWCYVTLTKI